MGQALHDPVFIGRFSVFPCPGRDADQPACETLFIVRKLLINTRLFKRQYIGLWVSLRPVLDRLYGARHRVIRVENNRRSG